MFSAKIKRSILKLLVSIFSVFNFVSQKASEEYKVFRGNKIPKDVKKSLVEAYKLVFYEEPWNEFWTEEEVLKKLENDLANENSFLVVFVDNNKVKGFVWGEIIETKDVEKRASRAMGIKKRIFSFSVPNQKILYCDEFALLKNVRKGPEPVKYLLQKTLEVGKEENVKSTLFWSTPESKIVPLAKMMGYEERGIIDDRDKKIIFLYHPDFRALLKITMLDDVIIKKILKALSKKSRND
jgi:hypothetical protein